MEYEMENYELYPSDIEELKHDLNKMLQEAEENGQDD